MTRRTLAALALLLPLGLLPAPALAQRPAEDIPAETKVEDKGSPVPGYVVTGAFAAGVLFAVCKSANRSTAP